MSRRERFLRWYRGIPLLLLLVAVILALASVVTPGALLRRFIYRVEHRDAILASAGRHGVDPILVCAIIKCESSWDATAVSDAGAIGLMQLMPDTAASVAAMGIVASGYDAANLTDPATNIEYGCAYLGYLQQNLSTRDQVVAAYNAGLGAVQGWMSGNVAGIMSIEDIVNVVDLGDAGGIADETGISDVIDISDLIAYPETKLYLVRVNSAYDRYQSLYDAELNPR